jgi:hypothetical protein
MYTHPMLNISLDVEGQANYADFINGKGLTKFSGRKAMIFVFGIVFGIF